MKCPYCRQTATDVYNTRATKFDNQTWRRRRCLSCKLSFTTYEAPDLRYLRIKRPGVKKTLPYSRAKLFSSIYQSFEGIRARAETIDAVTDTVEAKILDQEQPELTTATLVDIVLQTLRHFNTAAFVRYLTSHTDLASEAQLRKELKRY